MCETIKQVLMQRDEMTSDEAAELIAEAREEFNRRLDAGVSAYDICEEYFGLEPDYLFEFFECP